MRADDILTIYQNEAEAFARDRGETLWEAPLLAEAMAGRPRPSVLDLGCGTGRPLAAWYADHGAEVTGVDGASAMIERFCANLPGARAVQADMRGLDLGERFDVILAWNSLFHLAPEDQRAMFPVFAAHAAPEARLLFTTGPAAGEVAGQVGGSAVYHASLSPAEYRELLARHGFEEIWFRPEEPAFHGHSVWLARAY